MREHRSLAGLLALAAFVGCLHGPANPALPPANGEWLGEGEPVVAVSSRAGVMGNDGSNYASVSWNATHVSFLTSASNLFDGDTNIVCPPDPRFENKVNCSDVVVWSRETGSIEPASVNQDGSVANDASLSPVISGDGNRVLFESRASDLVPDDTNRMKDVFVRDISQGWTKRVNVATDGSEAQWEEDPNDSTYGSRCRYACTRPALSSDGEFAVFGSWSTNLVPDDTNRVPDVFLRDIETGTTERVSVDFRGNQLDGLSVAGERRLSSTPGARYVLFESTASNAVLGDTNRCPSSEGGPSSFDEPTCRDVFRKDRETGDVALVDATVLGRPANRGAWAAVISDDGQVVAFQSESTDLVPGDTNGRQDVFVHDFRDGSMTRISLTASGAQLDQDSRSARISADGNRIAFITGGRILSEDSDDVEDVYVYDRTQGKYWRASRTSTGEPLNDIVWGAQISPDGDWVVFSTDASNVVPNDANDTRDVFLVPVEYP